MSGVVGGSRSAAADGVGGDLAPGAGDVVAVGEHDQAVESVSEGVVVPATHCRSSAHWINSPMATKVMHGCLPMIFRMIPGGIRRLRLRGETSVSRTTRFTAVQTRSTWRDAWTSARKASSSWSVSKTSSWVRSSADRIGWTCLRRASACAKATDRYGRASHS